MFDPEWHWLLINFLCGFFGVFCGLIAAIGWHEARGKDRVKSPNAMKEVDRAELREYQWSTGSKKNSLQGDLEKNRT